VRTALASALVALILPASAAATIVPQRGIAGVNLNMTQPQVRAKLGTPDHVRHPTSPIFGQYTTWIYGKTRVDMFRNGDGKVFTVSTTGKAQKTAAGVGVGSTAAAVAKSVKRVHCNARHCYVGKFSPGGKVTDFILKAGRVTRVTIGFVFD
jgi:hypothetical protein